MMLLNKLRKLVTLPNNDSKQELAISSRQQQKAGENSTQIQATNVINVGISEKRAREIVDEKFTAAISQCSDEAKLVAHQRVSEYADKLIPELVQRNMLESFKDPSFQEVLIESQKSAAASERPADYDLLAQLLVHRISKGNERITRTGIDHAVKIVNEISDEALLGLTVAHCVAKFLPTSGKITDGLSVLDNLFGRVLYRSLPNGIDWIEHLDLLRAVRIENAAKMNSISIYYPSRLEGYVVVGIKKGSESFDEATKLLADNNLPVDDLLIENELQQGYVRIPCVTRGGLKGFSWETPRGRKPLSAEQTFTLEKIYDMYSKDANLGKDVQQNFIKKWDSFENLKKVREWWDDIPLAFTITSVGKVLAHSNAQRCDPALPNLD